MKVSILIEQQKKREKNFIRLILGMDFGSISSIELI